MKEARDDKALVEAILAGETDLFGVLVDRYQGVLFNIALRMVGDGDDAKDITQTVFLKAYEKLDTFKPRYKFFSWIYRIMINESLNWIGRQRPTDQVDSEILDLKPTPDQVLNRAELSTHVQEALLDLSNDHRSVIVLRHFADRSYADIGDVLGIPEKTVKSRLFSARRQLATVLHRRGVGVS